MVVPTTSALAPVYMADTRTCGGVTLGYLETGKVIIDKIPAMEMTREMTIAKIGLFIKNLDITFDPPIWTVRHRLKG